MKPMSLTYGSPRNADAVRETTAERPELDLAAMCARLALISTAGTLLLLASLHVLSPEFAPSWRMVSEYAYGRFGWVLSLMFFAWALSSWTLAGAIWSQVKTTAGRVGLWFLIIAGIGEAMAAMFDIRHDAEHSIAGLLGMVGFPIAAVLLSVSLGRLQAWHGARSLLVWIAHWSWLSVVLLVATLALMMVQFIAVNGGELPSQAPTALPAGVIGLDGWANRLNILLNCLWVGVVARQVLKVHRQLNHG